MNNNKLNRKLEIVPGEKKEYKGNGKAKVKRCSKSSFIIYNQKGLLT